MANIIPGAGVGLFYGTDGSTWTKVAARVSIEGFDISCDEIKTTDLDSTNETTRPATLIDPGEITLKTWHDPDDTTHQALLTKAQAPSVEWWSILMTDATPMRYKARGWVKGFKLSGMEAGSNVQGELKVRLTTKWIAA